MGFWSTRLYGNDVTADVKDTYMNCLEYNSDDADAMAEFMEEMKEYFSTDEECLVWYALADTQWKLGRLTDDVKNRAMQSIANDASVEFFEGKSKEKWRATLEKLNLQLQQPMKPYKRIRNLRDEVAEVWEIGDIYAYQFHTEEAKKNGIYGKYILMQKVADVEGERQKVFPAMVFFDKLYDEVPILVGIPTGEIIAYGYMAFGCRTRVYISDKHGSGYDISQNFRVSEEIFDICGK